MDNFFFIIQDKDYIDVKYVVKEMYFLTNFKRNSREGCPTSMKTKPREKWPFIYLSFKEKEKQNAKRLYSVPYDQINLQLIF